MYAGIDSTLSDNFGRSIIYALSALTTLVTVSFVGGLPFILAVAVLGVIYYNGKSRIDCTYYDAKLIAHMRNSGKSKIVIHHKCFAEFLLKIYGQTSRDMRRLGRLPKVARIDER